MEQVKTSNSEPHYYSERLRQKLNRLRQAPVTIVEAPSGYGKTTAVRDFLKTALPQKTPVLWYTAASDEAHSSGFLRFCSELEKIDGDAGLRLLNIGLPTTATVGGACDVLRSIKCPSEAYLVIDNFQYIQTGLSQAFFTALVEHGGVKLHIVIITQMLQRDLLAVVSSRGVLHINTAELRLRAEDIQSYFAIAGHNIAPEDTEEIARRTGGWIIAVYLILRAYRDTGSLSDNYGILTLMEQLVWDALTDEQQTFLLRLSPLGMATAYQACAVCGWEELPLYVCEALSNPFIRYDAKEHSYEPHSILSELLIRKRHERGNEFERECLLNAGDICLNSGSTVRALDFYAQAGAFERILRLDLTSFYFEKVGTTPFYELALQLSQSCTKELMQKYSLSMLQIAYALLTAGMDEEYGALLDALYPMLEKSDDEVSYLLGEWTLLHSYRLFPNIDEMTTLLKQADRLFDGKCSRVITPNAPWCYGIYTPFLVLHTVPGAAEREADALEKYIELYSRLTGGHGSGADVLFRLEHKHYQGELREAEILAYKAQYIAQGRRQKVIQLTATLHLAEIALEKADTSGWRHAIASLESTPGALLNIFTLSSAMETAQGLLLMELDKTEDAADWLGNGDFSGRQLPKLKSDRMTVYLGTLLKQKKYARLVGTVGAVYPEGVQVNCFQDVYIALITALGMLHSGDRKKATELVCAAVRMALPDRLFLPLLYYGLLLDGLVEDCIARDFPEQFARFETEKESFRSAHSEIYPELTPDELPGDLTAREREVALLAAKGLRNGEIAERLTVSETTVKFHLRTVFQKLDIDRRSKLAEKLK